MRRSSFVACLVFVACRATSSPSPTQPAPAAVAAPARSTPRFENSTVAEVVAALSRLTKVRIVVDPKLRDVAQETRLTFRTPTGKEAARDRIVKELEKAGFILEDADGSLVLTRLE